ncbi:MAG: uracil-DNA glycosylase [Alphaproteobacteria bacterium]|nr:uracil-DNA glycosylase [Alphaproteobacteria bacterium]
MPSPAAPAPDCTLCERLARFRHENRAEHPDWHNDPVPAFGALTSAILVVGLAPGLRGANRTGRPFTGDFAGDLLYESLRDAGLASGRYDRRADDGLELQNCRITNAVRCVPPQNKPTGPEIRTCRRFLTEEIAAMADLKIVLALGKVAHDSVITALGLRPARVPFKHGSVRPVSAPDGRTLQVADSYHCSRYNTSTRRLTKEMFEQVIAQVASAAR